MLLQNERGALKLCTYAKWLGIDENLLWGVRPVTMDTRHVIWSQSDRDKVARYFWEAQCELEDVLGYPIGPRWVEGERHRLSDKKNNKLFLHWGHVIGGGTKQERPIAYSALVNHAADPAVISVATTETNTQGVVVYHEGTMYEVTPLAMTLSGGVLTILIPRCRLVRPEYADNPAEGWDYNDLDVFAEAVDIVYRYRDVDDQARIYYRYDRRRCSSSREVSACIYVRNPDLGSIEIIPDDDSCWMGEYAEINYLAGYEPTVQELDAIMRLAHSKMPSEPCSCDLVENVLWQRDRNIPNVLTGERLNCRFGMSDGAWTVWQFAQEMRLHRAAVL